MATESPRLTVALELAITVQSAISLLEQWTDPQATSPALTTLVQDLTRSLEQAGSGELLALHDQQVLSDARADADQRVAAALALCDAAERGEGEFILSSPGLSTYHAVEVGRLRSVLSPAGDAPAPGGEPVHLAPLPGDGLTRCCGSTPFDLPRTDRITADPAAATCIALPDAGLRAREL